MDNFWAYLGKGSHGVGASLNSSEVLRGNADNSDKKKGSDFH